jgi:OOP family OmpA-OmpF porin
MPAAAGPSIATLGVDLFSRDPIVTRAQHRPSNRLERRSWRNTQLIREIEMHPYRKTGLLLAGLVLASVTGCGPIAFSDQSAMAIVGTAPEAAPTPEPQKRVELRDNKIIINEKIQFEFDSAKILPVSHDLLNEVAKVIKENPQIKKIEVEGHASAEGADDYNLKLSDKRAKSVMEYLTKTAGIAKAMLSSRGYGETRPIADNESDEGREKNRRVEFTITEQEVLQKKVEVSDDGSEKVIEEKKVVQ